MLLDDFLPEYHFCERHETFIQAPPDAVRRDVQEWRPNESFLWRWLVRLRGLGSPKGTLREWGRVERLPLPRRNGARGRVRPGWALLVPKRTRRARLATDDRGVPRTY